jgi:hypothetical protein
MTRPSRKRRASLGKLFIWQWAQFNGAPTYFTNSARSGSAVRSRYWAGRVNLTKPNQ